MIPERVKIVRGVRDGDGQGPESLMSLEVNAGTTSKTVNN